MAASATAEPDTPPIRVDSRIATCAKPPDIQPTATIETFSRRSVMPLSFMRWPASTKNGTASSGKLWLIEAIFCTPTDSGMAPSTTKKTRPAMPVAKATGMPTTMSTTNTMEISSMSVEPAGATAPGGSEHQPKAAGQPKAGPAQRDAALPRKASVGLVSS